MKNKLLFLILVIGSFLSEAQSTRMSLYEAFCGETCPPCASTNPVLQGVLSSPVNTPNVVSISWQTPIPSAPTNTWSLYQTNKIENDWRYKTTGGYGYGINFVPNGRVDGQHATQFGASSDNSIALNSTVIATAQSYTTPFSITMSRMWDPTFSSVTVTVNMTASSNFTATGNLVFRLVMIEREVHFPVQSGTNGEKDFYNAAVASFPTLQAGTAISGTWVNGQSQVLVINCPLPPYIRDKAEVAFVGFIQDDGNKKVWQATLAEKTPFANDAVAISAAVPAIVCDALVTPTIVVGNGGTNAITALTITPYVDAIAQAPFYSAVNLAPGASTVLVLAPMNVSGPAGIHIFSYQINGVSGVDFNMANNNKNASGFRLVTGYQATPVAEGFAGVFPPPGWLTWSSKLFPYWVKVVTVGGFQLTNECTKVDMYNAPSGAVSDLNLPALDLLGTAVPILTFDLAYSLSSFTGSDTLRVFASGDCGATWSAVYNKAGTALATAPANFMVFFPVSASDWRKETVMLTGFNSASVLLKFTAISGVGNHLYIDNINLSQSNPVSVNEQDLAGKADIYPNPANGHAIVRIDAGQSGMATIRVTNALGQDVYRHQYFLSEGSNELGFNTAQFAVGIYQVWMETPSGTGVKKLVVTK